MAHIIKIEYPVDGIATKSMMEKASEMGILDSADFRSDFFFKPGILTTAESNDILKPSIGFTIGGASGSIAISAGSAVTNSGKYIQVDSSLNKTLTLASYTNKTLFVKYVSEPSGSSLSTLIPLEGTNRNVAYEKDQDVDDIIFWESDYVPSTDEYLTKYPDSVPVGKLIYDGSYSFKLDEGFRRLALPKIPFIGKGHYSNEITAAIGSGSGSLYEFLASQGHAAARSVTNPFAMSTTDVDKLLDTFDSFIERQGIPALNLSTDTNKDMLKAVGSAWIGSVTIKAGNIIDSSGHLVVLPADTDIAVTNDSTDYTIYLQYKEQDGIDTYTLKIATILPATGHPIYDIATVNRTGNTITITDNRTTLSLYHSELTIPVTPNRLRLGWSYGPYAYNTPQTDMVALRAKWGDVIITPNAFGAPADVNTITIFRSSVWTDLGLTAYTANEWTNYYLWYQSGGSSYITKILSNTGNTITVETAVSNSVTNFRIVDKCNSYRMEIQCLDDAETPGATAVDVLPGTLTYGTLKNWTNVVDNTDWCDYDISCAKVIWNESRDIINTDYKILETSWFGIRPRLYYRIRITACNETQNDDYCSDPSSWVLIRPRTPSDIMTAVCLPLAGDFLPIVPLPNALLVRRSFVPSRKTAIENYFWMMQITMSWADSDAIKTMAEKDIDDPEDDGKGNPSVDPVAFDDLDIPKNEFPETPEPIPVKPSDRTTLVFPPTEEGQQIVVVPFGKTVWLKVRFWARDGSVSSLETIVSTGGIISGSPTGTTIPRPRPITLDDVLQSGLSRKLTNAKHIDFTATEDAVDTAKGTSNTLDGRMTIFEDIREKVDLAVSPTGKIQPSAIDEDSLSGMLVRADNLPDDEITDAKIKKVSASKLDGDMEQENLPPEAITANTGGAYGGLKKLADRTINATQTTICHGCASTPEYILPVAKGEGTVWVSQAADETNIYLTANPVSPVMGGLTVDIYVR